MTSPGTPATVPVAWAARRVEVYVAVPGPDGVPLLLGGPGGHVPGAVLGHGECPRDAAGRALAALPAAVRPADPDSLHLLQVHSEVRGEAGGSSLHVLRLVLAAPATRHPLLAGAVADPALLRDPRPAAAPLRLPGGPPQVQRPAAYAVVVREGEVLLSRVTGLGVWTLPGGGIDHGEHPDDAVRRETVEETGLQLAAARLLDVDSRHFTGHSPDRVLEDFHGVRILYLGEVTDRGEPQVQEIGGSTDAAAWVPLDRIERLRLADVVRAGLRARLERAR